MKIVGTEFTAFIKRSELARDRSEQRPERFAVGEKVDARVTQFDRRAHKVTVSIKALEVAEEKEAIAQYGSSDSGATLGDILGTALKRKGEGKRRTAKTTAGSTTPDASPSREHGGPVPRIDAAARCDRDDLDSRSADGNKENVHVARCRSDRRPPPDAAQADLLARAAPLLVDLGVVAGGCAARRQPDRLCRRAAATSRASPSRA